MIIFSQKLAVVWAKNANFFVKFLKNYLENQNIGRSLLLQIQFLSWQAKIFAKKFANVFASENSFLKANTFVGTYIHTCFKMTRSQSYVKAGENILVFETHQATRGVLNVYNAGTCDCRIGSSSEFRIMCNHYTKYIPKSLYQIIP
jgi:Na+-transporting NADH:ubiquinone oxidoreductase subunit NqrD